VGRCFEVAAKIAEELHVTEGFRVATNNGPGAWQSVPHIHFHLIAGRELSPIMG